MTRQRLPPGKRALFGFVAAAIVAAFLEVALTLLSTVSPSVARALASPAFPIPSEVPDARLRYRPNPLHPEHDRNGFRNPDVPRVADIVALGDSQTYGEGVEPWESWPRQLEALSGKKVYEMAFGGWGPVHSLILWDEAMALQPKVVIEALYAGNDVYDAFHLVYYDHQFPELKTVDPAAQKQIAAAESVETFEQRVESIFSALNGTSDQPVAPSPSFLATFLPTESKLYALVRRAVYELEHHSSRSTDPQAVPQDTAWSQATRYAEERPGYFLIFDDGRFRTIFTPGYRLAALDRRDARVREGQRILLGAIERMNRLANERDIRFLVVLVPTKEFVFRDVVSDPPPEYAALMNDEEAFWSATAAFFRTQSIEWVDALPALRRQLQTGSPPYPIDDGHPNKDGQHAIAEVVDARLNRSARQ